MTVWLRLAIYCLNKTRLFISTPHLEKRCKDCSRSSVVSGTSGSVSEVVCCPARQSEEENTRLAVTPQTLSLDGNNEERAAFDSRESDWLQGNRARARYLKRSGKNLH